MSNVWVVGINAVAAALENDAGNVREVLVEARARLAQVLTARSNDAAERLHQLQAWCREAEASGIHALQAYAARLKGYSLQATRA